ncbi:hypothetical protein MRS44_013767 [Fusarium solani]|uniref:uncharacterized protein n=1 Tax=Fusarium solani TaxID=169388 RepID=UPI0032C465CD|nr:hypothetical protein MRS44_013767 [Fusarium solani]
MVNTLYRNSLYIIRDVPDKDYGVVAADKVPKGTRILSEAPLIQVPRKVTSKDRIRQLITSKLLSLPVDQQKAYHNLKNSFEGEAPEVGIFCTNALPLGPNATEGGIFLHASRINHGCHPNAQESWNENINKLTIHACYDIEEGEEITITYLAKRAAYETRQHAIQSHFNFTSTFAAHALSAPCHPLAGLLKPLNTLRNVERMLKLLIAEGIGDVSIPRAYFDAFYVTIAQGDMARAKVFADRALYSRRIVEGDDSSMVDKLRQLPYHPYLHLHDFECWLWQQQKPRELQFADLRCALTFPAFKDLPGNHEVETEFFEATDWFYKQLKKHWAFLGEILSLRSGANLKLVVEDKNYKRVPVSLRTAEFEDKLDRSLLEEGNTVVVLFPEKDGVLNGTPGIVVEELKVLKVFLDYNPWWNFSHDNANIYVKQTFPMDLEELLLLSDKVQIYSSIVDGMRICYGCNKKSASLRSCTKCGFFFYCNETCQKVGYKDKGHHGDCNLLSNTDIGGLFRLKEDSLERHTKLGPGMPERECVVS